MMRPTHYLEGSTILNSVADRFLLVTLGGRISVDHLNISLASRALVAKYFLQKNIELIYFS